MSSGERPSAARLRAAKQQARRRFEGRDGIEGVGIGDGCVRVYVRARTDAAQLPADIDGVALECVEIGEITPRDTDV